MAFRVVRQHDGLQSGLAGGPDAWKNRVRSWVVTPSNHSACVIQCRVFRFPGAFGQTELAADLRRYVMELCAGQGSAAPSGRQLPERPAAPDPVLEFRGGEGRGAQEHPGIKLRGLLPFMDFARVLALKHGITETGTGPVGSPAPGDGRLSQDLYHEAREAFGS